MRGFGGVRWAADLLCSESAAVDGEVDAVDIGSGWRCEESDDGCDFFGCAEATRGDGCFHA